MHARLSGSIFALIALSFLVAASVQPGPAESAFPGDNGKIAWDSERDGDREIYVMNGDGSGLVQLTNNEGLDMDPAWSPDGSKIVFESTRDGSRDVWVMNADGTGATNLTHSSRYDAGAVWSPDGCKIAFYSDRSMVSHDIYVMNWDGSDVTQLTTDPAPDFRPAWSPDGTKIAFESDRGGGFREVWVMNEDGTGQTNLTNDPSDDRSAGWSPDGEQIAFRSNRNLAEDIFVMDADGSDQVNLTVNLSTLRSDAPAWSPDGTMIAYQHGTGASGLRDIYVMDADGSDPVQLTNTGVDRNPDWQPLGGPSCEPPGDERVWGDVDCSGGASPVSVIDGRKVVLAVVESPSAQPAGCPAIGSQATVDGQVRTWGDVDCSGGAAPVSVIDARKIVLAVAGSPAAQPAGCPAIGDVVLVS